MANKKFSEFVLKTSTSDVSHIVGYNGAENVQITPANFVTGGGTGVFLPLAGGTMTGDTVHNDGVKSIYGNPGNDLQISHDGTNSFITNTGAGAGSLIVRATNFAVQSADGTDDFITTVANAQVNLFFNDSKKFETTSTGISVTGDGLFTTNVKVSSTIPLLYLTNTTVGTGKNWRLSSAPNGKFFISEEGIVDAITLDPTTGNAIFAGNVKIEDTIELTDAGATRGKIELNASDRDDLDIKAISLGSNIKFFTVDSERMRLDSSGRLGVGTSNPTDTVTISNDNNLLLGLDSPAANDAQLRFYKAGTYKHIIYRPANSDDLRFNTSTSGDVLTIQQSGNATFAGDIVVGTSGKGILLGGTAAANRLSEYEEGICTLRLTSDTAFDNESDVNCNFTRVGNLVTVFVSVNLNGTPSGGSGNVKITGLPFTAAANGYGAVRFGRVNLTSSIAPFGAILQVSSGTTECIISFAKTDVLGTLLTAATMNSSAGTPLIDGVLTYRV